MVIQTLKHKRQINEREFKKLKKLEPFNTFRQDSKGLNFGLLFGMSYRTYSKTRLENNWSYDQCEKFIDEHDLRDQKWKIAEFHKSEDPKLWSFYTVSKYFRDIFFKTYPGLNDRIKERRAEGKETGFIRSIHGAIRHTIPLLLEGKDEDKKEVASYLNIAANTDIQNDEAYKVMSSIVEFNRRKKELGFKSRIIGTIHDSVDFIIYKSELKYLYQNHILPVFESQEEWQEGISLAIDMLVVDLMKEGEYYKHGKDIKECIK